MTIINSTIRENQGGTQFSSAEGGGILNNGTLQLKNTIIASNIDFGFPVHRSECSGTIMSLGNNFIGDPSGCNINLQPSDLTGNPGLAQLVESETPGEIYYPVEINSPVIGAADKKDCTPNDQLGNVRAATCDIGAIDFQCQQNLTN